MPSYESATASPSKGAASASVSGNMDVWPTFTTQVDPSRVDRVAAALRTKIETTFNFDDPNRAVKKLFQDADIDKNNELDEEEFVKLMVNKMNFSGYDSDVRALFKRFDIDSTGRLDMKEFTAMLFNEPGSRATTAIGKVREILAKRSGGATTLKGMAVQFKILDRDATGSLDRQEMQIGLDKFLRGYGVQLSKSEVDELFKLFDADRSGTVSYDEFIKGLRGSMNQFRVDFVKLAWYQLDTSRKGYVTVDDLGKVYDVSGNPLVKAGKITPQECLKAFMNNWHLADKKHLDTVSLDDFIEYYDWVSSSIDRDDYFELMIRNAWHISGGDGWSANTSNLRVLVTHQDGRQTVECIDNDLGLKRDDFAEIKRRLKTQGIDAKAISLKD